MLASWKKHVSTDGTEGYAKLSDCGRYRYGLIRRWEWSLPSIGFLMLNPSTADHREDDPTIRKCRGFAELLGFGAIHVVNLFAWRSTDPRGLTEAADAVGPDNNAALLEFCKRNDRPRMICAWGGAKTVAIRDLVAARRAQIAPLLHKGHFDLYCLGHAQCGSPRHPLMLAYATDLLRFTI